MRTQVKVSVVTEDHEENEVRLTDSERLRWTGTAPGAEALADDLEALRCLSYLIRNDAAELEHLQEYMSYMDNVLDRMADELRERIAS